MEAVDEEKCSIALPYSPRPNVRVASLITGVMGAAKVEMVNGSTLSELMEE